MPGQDVYFSGCPLQEPFYNEYYCLILETDYKNCRVRFTATFVGNTKQSEAVEKQVEDICATNGHVFKQKYDADSPPSHCRDDHQNKKPWIPAILLASESLQGFPVTKQNKGTFVSQLLTL